MTHFTLRFRKHETYSAVHESLCIFIYNYTIQEINTIENEDVSSYNYYTNCSTSNGKIEKISFFVTSARRIRGENIH